MKASYLEFHGKCYVVGTRMLVNPGVGNIGEAIFNGYKDGRYEFIDCANGRVFHTGLYPPAKILDIIEPVEVEYVASIYHKSKRHQPMDWEIDNAWIWYIIIMIGGTFFYDRLLIWIFATIYFILWKNGFLGGNK